VIALLGVARPLLDFFKKGLDTSITRLLVRQDHADVVKEVRPQKHNCVCSKERTIMHCAVLARVEVRAHPTSAP